MEKRKKLKVIVTEKQYIAAQTKAYKIWNELMIKQPVWVFDSSLNGKHYIAFATNPKPRYYVVLGEHNTINTATGMFRFPNEKLGKKFITKMGKSMKHLFPSVNIG